MFNFNDGHYVSSTLCVAFVCWLSRWRRSSRRSCQVTHHCDCRPTTQEPSVRVLHPHPHPSSPPRVPPCQQHHSRLVRRSPTSSHSGPGRTMRHCETLSTWRSSRLCRRRCHCAMPRCFCPDSFPLCSPTFAT